MQVACLIGGPQLPVAPRGSGNPATRKGRPVRWSARNRVPKVWVWVSIASLWVAGFFGSDCISDCHIRSKSRVSPFWFILVSRNRNRIFSSWISHILILAVACLKVSLNNDKFSTKIRQNRLLYTKNFVVLGKLKIGNLCLFLVYVLELSFFKKKLYSSQGDINSALSKSDSPPKDVFKIVFLKCLKNGNIH